MIRNQLYIKNQSKIESLTEALYDTLDKLPGCSDNETMEETEIRYALQKAAEVLDDAAAKIKYFQKPVKEGYLERTSNDRFQLCFEGESSPHVFSCGYPIEVYLEEDPENNIDGGWYAGRVEHNGEGYYFYGPGKPLLYQGMKARIRVDE